jgi:hypothetical protein
VTDQFDAKAFIPSWAVAIALALTSATQVRLWGLPIGAGEILLSMWLASVFMIIVSLRMEVLATLDHGLSRFWMASFVGLAVGFANGLYQNIAPPSGTRIYDTLAYLFSAGISIALVLQYGRHRHGTLALQLGLALAIPLSAFWLIGINRDNLVLFDLWDGHRFLGWTNNPNQAGLVLVLVPFLVFHYIEERGRDLSWLAIVGLSALVGLAMLAGWATASRALRLTLIVTMSMLVVGLLFVWRRHERRLASAFTVAVLLSCTTFLAGNWLMDVSSRPVNPESSSVKGLSVEAFQASVLNRGYPGAPVYEMKSVRGPLIMHGMTAIGDSRLLGFGPGQFSGLERPYLGSEVHNIFVDWFVSTGLLGFAALVLLLAHIAIRLWKRRCHAMLLGVMALTMFGQFHFILRHPIAWGCLAIAWIAGRPAGNGSPAEAGADP